MATGAPDYYSQTYVDIVAQTLASVGVNIILQDLAEVVERNKYGGATRGVLNISSVLNTYKEMISISGAGVIYGGWIRPHIGANHSTDLIQIILDGNVVLGQHFGTIYSFTRYNNDAKLVFITRYDDVNNYFEIGFKPFVTFESELTINYKDVNVGGVGILGELFYATV